MFEVDDIIKEAIIGYYSGDLTKDQADVLLNWIHKDPRHLRYFQEMGEIWNSSAGISIVPTDTAAALGNIRKKIADRDLRRIPSREIRLRLSTIYKMAAAVLLLIAIGVAAFKIRIPASSEVPVAFVETSGSQRFKITDHFVRRYLNLVKCGHKIAVFNRLRYKEPKYLP